MKKLIALIMMAMMMSLPLAFAQSTSEEGPDFNGAPDWDRVRSELGFLDRLSSSAQPLTIVNGAQCSTFADWSRESVISTTSKCWDNFDGGSPGGNGVEHIGVAYQVFDTSGSQAVRVDEIFIDAGDKGCVVDLEPGKSYFRQAFYCDDTSVTCSKFVSICNNEGGVVRARNCVDASGDEYREEVQTDWMDSSVGTCEGATIPPPPKPNPVDSGDDGSGVITPSVTTPEPPKPVPVDQDGNPVEELDDAGDLAGEWSQLAVPTNVKVGSQYTMTGVFTAEKSGTYYLEAGMFERQLSAITATESQCDGSKEFGGEFVTLEAGEAQNMIFNLEAVDNTGVKSVVFGAFSGCLSEGGEEIVTTGGTVNVLNSDGSPSGIASITGNVAGIGGSDISGRDVGIVIGLTVGGALIGSFVPVFGNIVGGVIGFIIGVTLIVI